MAISNTNISTICGIIFFLLLSFNIQIPALRQKITSEGRNAIVVGLTNSRSSLSIPKVKSRALKAVDVDVVEQLKEVRDGYLITLTLGTPPQLISVYLDTGSDLTWVPCGNLSFNCVDCDDYVIRKINNKRLLNPNFSPLASSSLSRDICRSSFCLAIHSSDNSFDTCTVAGCSLTTLLKRTCSRPCPPFAYTYDEGSLITGDLTRDTLKIHGTNPEITKDVSRFCFGCVMSSYREPIGIAGFGRGPLSLPSQLGFLQKGFSHCFLPFKYANNFNISSPLVIGDIAISPKENMQFTPMLNTPMYPNSYYIGLEAITVGNKSLAEIPLSLREFDSQGNGGLLIDSGTTYIHLPNPFYSQILSILQSLINYPRARDIEERTGFDLCYKVPFPSPNNNDTDYVFPSITLHFLNDVSLLLPQGNNFHAMGAPRNSTVVNCLLFQSMDDGDYGPAGVFGSFQQQNIEVVYDLEKERIGFRPMDCASAAASHELHKK